MLILISRAKCFDFESHAHTQSGSETEFTTESSRMIKKVRTFSKKKLGTLISISPELVTLNVQFLKNALTEARVIK